MLKKIFVLILQFGLTLLIFAQSSPVIHGKLMNKKSREPVAFAFVYVKETDQIALSDATGAFSIRTLNLPLFNLEIKCLGFETFEERIETAGLADLELKIEMVPISYDMEEISVLSKNDQGITSSSFLESAAIEYVQPPSLSDVMQLIPGQLSINPDLRSPQKISIREIGVDNNNSIGTAIWVDGAPLSNDANLQTFSTSRSGDNFSTVVGSGIDLRQISTDQIESVEVIRGIPSVTYGDLTSGAVVVKTKSGYTPFEIKLKADPNIKQLTFGKGMKLKSPGSSMNLNFDYLQSFDDISSKYMGFNRLTTELGYSKIFNLQTKPLTFHSKLSYYATIDDAKTDPDAMVAGEKIYSGDKGLRFNMHGKWWPELRFLSSLEYMFSATCNHQKSSEDKYRSVSGIQMISISLIEGENDGIFLPSEQFTNYVVDGRPVTFFGQITARKQFQYQPGSTNQILYGFDYRSSANYGEGPVYNVANPPFISSYSSRPRKYKDIPALTSYSIYLEDKLMLELGKTVLDVQAGIRLNNFQSKGLFMSQLGFFTEPRLNAQYKFLSKKNSKIFDKLAVSFGIGKTFKSPSLLYLYPDKAYFDLSALSYYTGDPATNLAVMDTRIYETRNPDLKPSENLKIEAGLSFKIKKAEGFITVFKERLTNGFDFVNQYLFLNYNRYQAENLPAGAKPDPKNMVAVSSTIPVFYRAPVNNKESQKSGIEFGIDFGKIKAIYTSFSLDGALLRTKRISSTIPFQNQPLSNDGNPYLYFGIYPAGESKISGRLNTNLRMVTQIPRLRLIFSSTLQMIWYDRYYYPLYDEAPVHLVLADGSTQPFTAEMRKNPNYARFANPKTLEYYLEEIMPPLPLANFRLSKEISDRLKLSLYVNNFVNYRPEYEYKRSGSFTRRNPSVYFGAELKVIL
jgi:outer membrane receptor protein involved in Fe transport